MTLTNNQLGRIQLILQELLSLQLIPDPDNEDAQNFVSEVYDLFQPQELQQINSDLKHVYNTGKTVIIVTL